MGVLRVRDPQTRSWIDITSSADEVEVSTLDPALLNAGCELWYDVNTTPGILKARVNGAWEAVEVSEVHVGPDDPYDLNPDAQDQLFYDTSIQQLMVRVNDTWQPVTILDPNEVFVGASTPTPDVEIWYDTASTDALPVDGILKVRDTRTGLWHVATPEEVWVDDQDPLSRGNTEAELWFDLSLTPPVLKANVSGVWIPVSPEAEPPLDEVWVGQGRPDPVGTYELWVDTSTDPPLLYGKNEAGVWVPLTFPAPIAPPNEVVISPAQPADITTELWVDTTPTEPILKANIAGAWVQVSPSEVEVSDADPYLDPAGSRAELWHDRSLGQNGILKVRIGNDWRPVAEMAQSETEISATDPIVYNPQAELWVDTTTTPPTLWGRVNNGWVHLTGPVADAPQEVEIGPVDPRDAAVELWYDTTNTPGLLKANNFGTWEPIAGLSEVTVDNIDPYLTNPDSTDELWFNPSMGKLYARFNDQWLEANPDAPNEVTIQGSEPSNPDVELWHDISTDPPVLKAKVAQQWKPVIPASADEVWVGPEDPDVVEPESERDLWYDTDAWGRGSGGFPGGNANEALVKVSDVDSDVRWGGDLTVPNNLLVKGDATVETDVRVPTDGHGILLNGDGGLVKKAGGGIVLRKHTGGTHPTVENADGTGATNIITANGAAHMTGTLQFPNATADKVYLYSQDFGLGVNSGETVVFASGKVGFRDRGYDGTLWGSVDANGFAHSGVWVPTLKVLNNVSLVVGHWYEVSNCDYHRTVRFRIGVIGPGKPTRSQSLDGIAALLADEGEGASLYSGYLTVYGHLKGKMANNKLFDSIGVGPTKLWIRCSQAATVQVGIQAYDTASGGRTTLSFADGGTAPGVWDSVAL